MPRETVDPARIADLFARLRAAVTPCTRCGHKPRRSPNQRWCLDCHAESMRRTRPAHSDLPDEARRRANCRAYAHVYLRRGKLTKPTACSRCPRPAEEMHHADYSRPLEIEWLCRPCHLLETASST